MFSFDTFALANFPLHHLLSAILRSAIPRALTVKKVQFLLFPPTSAKTHFTSAQ